MTTVQSDIVIVGARCAGATLATLLARRGLRVLVLDSGAEGTGQALSTHFLQPPAMAVLDKIGVGDAIRACTPATKVIRGAFDEWDVIAPLEENRYSYCPRRTTLDPLLQQAAQNAGAELRFHHTVRELIWEHDRVVGVTADTAQGRENFYAPLVVGADGAHSTVARLVGAESYLEKELTRGGYWLYFPAPTQWPYPWDATLEHMGEDLRYVFRTDGDQILLATTTTRDKAASWGAQHLEKTLSHLRGSPTMHPLMEGREPIGKGAGLLKSTFFYRRPVGPGWALVGDAGHYKDFVTGQGIADAVLDAERLAEAIVDGRPLAYERYWRARDVDTMPLHFDAIRQGQVGYNNPFVRWLYRHLHHRPDLMRKFAKVNLREIRPTDFIPMSSMLGWMGHALVRGRFDVLKTFWQTGQLIASEEKEMKHRQALLDAVQVQLGLN